jgi:hypothetical protein
VSPGSLVLNYGATSAQKTQPPHLVEEEAPFPEWTKVWSLSRQDFKPRLTVLARASINLLLCYATHKQSAPYGVKTGRQMSKYIRSRHSKKLRTLLPSLYGRMRCIHSKTNRSNDVALILHTVIRLLGDIIQVPQQNIMLLTV